LDTAETVSDLARENFLYCYQAISPDESARRNAHTRGHGRREKRSLLYGAGVGRSAGQGEAHELRPVDRQRRAGVRIRLPLIRTVSLNQSWVPFVNRLVPSTYGA
jgi:hypothetical protein